MRRDGRKVYKTYGSAKAKFLQNYDGDTFKADIDEWPIIIGRYTSIRIAGIQAPEMYQGDTQQKMKAERSRIALYDILSIAKDIKLVNIRRGKFFRLIAGVIADEINIGQFMIEKGYAIKMKDPE